MTYKPASIPEQTSDGMTPTGYTSRQLVELENKGQRIVAEAENWMLAVAIGRGNGKDSREVLESLGFTILQRRGLFYETVPPDGWSKATKGYWTFVNDSSGNERLAQFYKAAFYDTEAFLQVVEAKS